MWNDVRGWNSRPYLFVQDITAMSIETITLEVDIPVSVVMLLSFLGSLSRSRSVMLIDVVGGVEVILNGLISQHIASSARTTSLRDY